MLSHVNLGTNDLEKAEKFYDSLTAIFGGTQSYKSNRTILYSIGEGSGKIAINIPFDGEQASSGNGTMIALSASNKEQVDEVYKKAIELGGSCEGAPGKRMGGAMYAAYFRDLDANKFGIFCAGNQ